VVADSTSSVRIVGLGSHVGLDNKLRSAFPLDRLAPLAISTTAMNIITGTRISTDIPTRDAVEVYRSILGEVGQDQEMVPTSNWNDMQSRSKYVRQLLFLDLDSQDIDMSILSSPMLGDLVQEHRIEPPSRTSHYSPDFTNDRSSFLRFCNRPYLHVWSSPSEARTEDAIQGILEAYAAVADQQSAGTLVIPTILSTEVKPSCQILERLAIGTGAPLEVDSEAVDEDQDKEDENHHQSLPTNTCIIGHLT